MTELPGHTAVLVVGTGFAGLGAAIRLRQTGRHDFLVLERAASVGGTWRDNGYPGCACDVPSHLYSFSFAPNPHWTRSFSPQGEIEAYLERTAAAAGVLPHIRFGTELIQARWDEPALRWRITTSRGELTADHLVLGTGALSEPKLPAIRGLGRFAGTSFHSAGWNHAHDLTGRRVAVIGTGASAIQFVPHVQREARAMTLFQRTAPWVLPRRDRAISGVERRLFAALPVAQRLSRAGIYAGRESWLLGFAVRPKLMGIAERQALRHLHAHVPDPALRATLTPTFRLGCKRVLLSNDYYPALSAANASVCTDPIIEVRPHAIVTGGAAGARIEHEVDTIIFGTGFKVTEQPVAERIVGRDGVRLSEHWDAHGMSALHGLTVAGFPNLFVLVGPNTGLGHSSIVLMIEAQIGYLLDLLDQLDAAGIAAVEPRTEVQATQNAVLQAALATTVWSTGGCSSWYLDGNGRNTTLWPTFTWTFRRQLAKADLSEYHTVRA